MNTKFVSREADGRDHILDGLVFQGRGAQLCPDPLHHFGIFFRTGIQVFRDVFNILPFQTPDGPAGGQFGCRPGGEGKFAGEHERGAGRTDMDFLGPIFPKFF